MQSLVRIVTICTLAQLAPLAVAQGRQSTETTGRRGAHLAQKLAALSPAEREQLRTAHAKAMQDPALRAAHLKMRQAHREFRENMRASLLKADPTIQPVLNKIPEGRGRSDS